MSQDSVRDSVGGQQSQLCFSNYMFDDLHSLLILLHSVSVK